MVNIFINEREPKLDRLQLVALAVLMFIGTMFVYSATMANAAAGTLPWYDQIWVRQIIWYALGLGAAAAIVPRGLSHAGALVVRGLLGHDFLAAGGAGAAHRHDAWLGCAPLD